MRRTDALRVLLFAAAAFFLSAGLASCSKQSSGDISTQLADKLTDSFGFEGAEKKTGKPLEGGEGPDFPQIVDFTAPSELYDGLVYKVNLHSDYAGKAKQIVGAQVFVENAEYHLAVPGTMSGGMLVLNGKFKWDEIFAKYGSNPVVYFSLVAADGGSSGLNWINPVAGKAVKWQPAVRKSSANPVSGQELTDMLAGPGMSSEWGDLSDDGKGAAQPAPPALKLITVGPIQFDTDFDLAADLSGDLTNVVDLLLQIEGSKTMLARKVTAEEKAAKKVLMILRFSTQQAKAGALSSRNALDTGSAVRPQTTFVLKAALRSGDGNVSKPDKLPVEVNTRPSGTDGGTPAVVISAIDPADPYVTAGMQVHFHANVSGTSDTKVLWSAGAGSIDENGLFTAPEEPGSVTITARAQADESKSSSTTAQIVAPPKVVKFYAEKTSLLYGEETDLHVEYSGASADIEPGLKNVASGSSVKIGPLADTTYTLTVKNEAGDTAEAALVIKVATVTVGPVAPASPEVAPGEVLKFSAKVGGALETGVNWSATEGSILADGTWIAPGAETDVIITATSKANPTVFAVTTAYVRKRTMLASGGSHVCYLLGTTEVKCWGYNTVGQTGINNSGVQMVLTPQFVQNPPVGNLSGARAIALGQDHSCALMADTGVKCWGRNNNGQLGNQTTNMSLVPVDVKNADGSTLTNVAYIAMGNTHSCALMKDATMKCWGGNSLGQLGDGGTTMQTGAVKVMDGLNPLAAVKGIAAGGSHTCALLNDGGVKCWGGNSNGQLGNGTTSTSPTAAPVDVIMKDLSKLAGAAAISLGNSHTCALMADTGIKCWGYGTSYQLGTGQNTSQSNPVDVTKEAGGAQTGFTSVNAGAYFTCAGAAGGQAMCWGANSMGQAGTGKWDNYIMLPAPVADEGLKPVDGIKSLAAGIYYACLQVNDGSVKCWGWNQYGQLGNGKGGGQKNTAADVYNLSSGAKAVAAGRNYACAHMNDNTVKCWGRNDSNQLSDGSTIAKPLPVDVINADKTKLQQVGAFAAGGAHACSLSSDNTVYCWGLNNYGQVGVNSSTTPITSPAHVVDSQSNTITGAAALGLGGQHSCAVISGGTVRCWGANNAGQLGNGTTSTSVIYAGNVMNAVGGNFTGAASVALGYAHSCVAMSNKTARCWGQGSNYQLGTGSVSSVYNPTGVWINGNQTPLTGVLAVTAGYAHSCALVEQTVPPGPNTVACWGYNNSGQIGDGSTTNMPFPATVRIDADNTLQNAVAVKAGDYHTCALLANGSLWCWGQNTYGQVGNGTLTNQLFAVQVSGISSPLSFSAGQYSSCAVTAGGGVKCWGWDNYGELGDLYWSAFPLDVGM